MKQYVDLTGKPIMPPKWALGFAQCRGLLTSEKLSYEIAEGYRKRGIPCDVYLPGHRLDTVFAGF